MIRSFECPGCGAQRVVDDQAAAGKPPPCVNCGGQDIGATVAN
jgi:transcription elongation factor Elf1